MNQESLNPIPPEPVAVPHQTAQDGVQTRVFQDLTNSGNGSTGRRSRRNNITADMRKRQAIERAAKNEAAWAALQVAILNHKNEINRIASEHGVNAKQLRRKALHTTALKTARKTNSYNAFRRFKKINLENHNFHITEEQRAFLIQLQEFPIDEGYKILRESPDDIKDLVMLIHDQYRMSKNANSRGSRRSVGQSVRRSCERISAELESMSSRCRTSAICIVVRASTTGTHDPFIYTDNISKEFIENVKNLNVNVLAEQFEGHAIQGFSSIAKTNSDGKRLQKKAEVRELVRSGLREITGKNNITMSWSNYQQAIIAKHHVQLVGWPSDLTFDIDGMSSTDLQGIIKGFKNCLIKWERTEGYMDQSESEMVPKRRQRSDKGKKRSTYRTRKQSGTITNTSAMRDATSDSDSSDSSSDTSSDSDSEDNE